MDTTLASRKNQLAGAWKLISFEVFSDDAPGSKPIAKPHGELPFGRIVFTPSGYMTATLTPRERAMPLKTSEWIEASDKDVVFVARGMTTYSGPYRLFEEGEELRLHCDVEIALNPNWIGKPQLRKVTIHEEKGHMYLTLRPLQYLLLPVSPLPLNELLVWILLDLTNTIQDGSKTLGVLVWEKLESSS
jgi:hypothetical protein